MQDRPTRRRQASAEPIDDRAVYIISVAAELAGVHPQTLRIYERKGLLSPARTPGNTRRYSDQDIERLRMIQELTQEHGINLAGVKMIVEMENELEGLRKRMESLGREYRRTRERMLAEMERLQTERPRSEIVPVSAVQRLLRRVEAQDLRAAIGRRTAASERRGPIAVGPVTDAPGRNSHCALPVFSDESTGSRNVTDIWT
jgi:MerR family transcriptional regulator/heat shock protein HspR